MGAPSGWRIIHTKERKNCWFPVYKQLILEIQGTSKTHSVSHWSIFEGVSNIDQIQTEGVLLVTWFSNRAIGIINFEKPFLNFIVDTLN